MFTSPDGSTLRIGNWRSRVFEPARAAAGLQHVRPHDLRHTAASLAISSGATVKAVQSMLGHASAAMTLDIYASLFAGELDAVADAMDAARPAFACRDPRRIRGATLRQVVKATYVQVWWPAHDQAVQIDPARFPVWDGQNYIDPQTGVILPTWEEALDQAARQPVDSPSATGPAP